MIDPKKFLRTILIGLVFVGIASYAFFRSKDAIFGITIKSSVPSFSIQDDTQITLTGSAPHAAHFTINNREILLDSHGDFTDTFLLQNGYNVIELRAEDRFGREKKKVLQIYAKPTNVS